MAVTNPGDPVGTLSAALDAYATVQQTMIDEAAKFKQRPAEQQQPIDIERKAGTDGVVSS